MNVTTMAMPAFAHKPLRIFVFYTDFPAGVHAKTVVDFMFREAVAEVEPKLDFWKLDSIPPVGPLKNLIVNEAREADVWIIASSSPCNWDAMIMQWMNCLAAKEALGKAAALLIGLFGNSTPAPDAKNFEWLLELFSQLAKHTGVQFIWQPMDRGSTTNLDFLKEPVWKLMSEKVLMPLPIANSSPQPPCGHSRTQRRLDASVSLRG